MPHRRRPDPNRLVRQQRRTFLRHFARLGGTTQAADAAGLSLETLAEWVQHDRGFREAFHEARLRFHDSLEVEALRRIQTGKDPAMLRFRLEAELPEKYGRPKKPKAARGLTMGGLERLPQKARDWSDQPSPPGPSSPPG